MAPLSGFLDSLKYRPVIAASREPATAVEAAGYPVSAVFLLGGSIMQLPDAVGALHAADKRVFIHIDLCSGLGRDEAAVEWCHTVARPDGLISTRYPLLRAASERGMVTIQRLFLMDSSSLQNGIRLMKANPPDMVEVLPGLVPKSISMLSDSLGLPVIAGGMITEPAEAASALAAGAVAVSTSEKSLWRGR